MPWFVVVTTPSGTAVVVGTSVVVVGTIVVVVVGTSVVVVFITKLDVVLPVSLYVPVPAIVTAVSVLLLSMEIAVVSFTSTPSVSSTVAKVEECSGVVAEVVVLNGSVKEPLRVVLAVTFSVVLMVVVTVVLGSTVVVTISSSLYWQSWVSVMFSLPRQRHP